MHLFDISIFCILVGLALYAILGGADFGAGLWQLTALPPPGHRWAGPARRVRAHAHHAMGPVWEANHVWLIFVLTVTWTAFPPAFAAIMSTLAVPLLIAAVGIVFRGAAYAARVGQLSARQLNLVDTVFSISSVLTPFGLGVSLGAITAGRVPVGNANGPLFSSWLNPLSIALGLLFVALSAYTAAIYLAADAQRQGDDWMAEQFRIRALIASAVAGVIALASIPLMHSDAHRVFERLVSGIGLIGLVISVLGGLATMVLITQRRYGPARITAALAVGGIVLGWALAQQPVLLPGLTLRQAAAPSDTQIVVLVAIAVGAVVLFPSLWVLFRLQLGGRFDAHSGAAAQPAQTPVSKLLLSASARGLMGRIAIACFLAGIGFLNAADAAWAHILGVVALVLCLILGVGAMAPTQMAADTPGAD